MLYNECQLDLVLMNILKDVTKFYIFSTFVQRRSKHPMPEDSKDDKYWRRRAKNNEAAKRSREAKRMKEDEVLQKVEGLESENEILR